MKSLKKSCTKILISHISAVIISLVLLTFLMILSNVKYGMQIYSTIATLIYVVLIYLDSWKMGQLENKPYNETVANPIRGIIATSPIVIIALILMLLYVLPVNGKVIQIAFCIWFAPMCGFFAHANQTVPFYVFLICSIIPMIVAYIGYKFGMKGYSLSKKMQANQLKKQKMRENMSKERKKRSFF